MDTRNECAYCGKVIVPDENFGFCDEDDSYLCASCLDVNTRVASKSIFFITGIEIKPLSSYHQTYIDYQMSLSKKDINTPMLTTRTFGWAPTYRMAEEWVRINVLDISEGGSFKWVVIEEAGHGLYICEPLSQVFFQFAGDWELNGGSYKKLEGWPKEVEDYYGSTHLVRFIASIG